MDHHSEITQCELDNILPDDYNVVAPSFVVDGSFKLPADAAACGILINNMTHTQSFFCFTSDVYDDAIKYVNRARSHGVPDKLMIRVTMNDLTKTQENTDQPPIGMVFLAALHDGHSIWITVNENGSVDIQLIKGATLEKRWKKTNKIFQNIN